MISSENFKGIRAFVQAEQSGSFAAASAVLGLSQSAVSKSIARLEERLDVRLFHRTTRNLTLTDEGRLYLESCRRALEELTSAEFALAARKDTVAGCVRLNLPELYGRHCVSPALLKLANQHPQLRFEVSFENRITNLVEDGYDLAVRIGELQYSADLIAKKIGQQEIVVCASPNYLNKHPAPFTLAELNQHDCITQYRAGQCEPWYFLNIRHETMRVNVATRHAFTATDVIVEAGLEGLGLIQVPSWLVEHHLKSQTLVRVLTDIATPVLPIHIIWPRGRVQAYRVRAVIDTIARCSMVPE